MSETALALVEQSGEEKPSALMRRATDVANICKAVVTSSAKSIQGKRYIEVEGWCTIAAAYGCVPSIREVVEEERGVRAVAELKRADGSVVAAAEGFCGLDEPTWANRAMYARRGMAQTRAISRVCRTAFAFVVKLMDAGLETTPVEEIPNGDSGASVKPASSVVVDAAPSNQDRAVPERTQATRVRFGKDRSKFLCDIDASGLQWQLDAARRSVEANDPKWGESNKVWLASVEAEVSRRGR
jgi:hypothetical protein